MNITKRGIKSLPEGYLKAVNRGEVDLRTKQLEYVGLDSKF